jgi:hypothetical protein
MKRIRMMGLALVAVFAFSAMVASAAQAGEYGTCVKTVKVNKKYTGNYTDANCTVVNAKHEGEYEWAPTPVGSHIKTTDTSTTATLKSALGSVVCKKSKSTGEITGPKTDTEIVTFETCETSKKKCTSVQAGEKVGNITTYLLDTSLIDHGEKGLSGKEPVEGEVWTQFVSSEHEPYQAQFTCVGVPGVFEVSGSLSGVNTINVNKMSTTGTVTFTEKGGEQDLILTDTALGFTGPSEEITIGKTKGPKMEIKT